MRVILATNAAKVAEIPDCDRVIDLGAGLTNLIAATATTLTLMASSGPRRT